MRSLFQKHDTLFSIYYSPICYIKYITDEYLVLLLATLRCHNLSFHCILHITIYNIDMSIIFMYVMAQRGPKRDANILPLFHHCK